MYLISQINGNYNKETGHVPDAPQGILLLVVLLMVKRLTQLFCSHKEHRKVSCVNHTFNNHSIFVPHGREVLRNHYFLWVLFWEYSAITELSSKNLVQCSNQQRPVFLECSEDLAASSDLWRIVNSWLTVLEIRNYAGSIIFSLSGVISIKLSLPQCSMLSICLGKQLFNLC